MSNPRNMKIKQQIILGIGAIVTIVIILAVLSPSLKKIKIINQNISQRQLTLEESYLKGKNINKSKNYYESVKEQAAILESVFIQPGQELEFITALENIARQNGLIQIINIDSKKIEQALTDGRVQKVKVEIHLEGKFADVIRYLDQVQNLNFYYNIDELNFSNPTASSFNRSVINKNIVEDELGGSPNITVRLAGLTFWK